MAINNISNEAYDELLLRGLIAKDGSWDALLNDPEQLEVCTLLLTGTGDLVVTLLVVSPALIKTYEEWYGDFAKDLTLAVKTPKFNFIFIKHGESGILGGELVKEYKEQVAYFNSPEAAEE